MYNVILSRFLILDKNIINRLEENILGKTIIEKILQEHCVDDIDVKSGEIIWIDIDKRTARDFGGANVVKNMSKYFDDDSVQDVSKTLFTFDCVVPAKTIPYANNQHICRQYAREKNISVYDVNAGIGSHVAIEEGHAYPNCTFIGTDSHLNILGAVGAFGQGMGDQDIAFSFKTGVNWFEVPPTMKINLKGDLPDNVGAKDLILFLIGKLGSKGALGKAVEIYGDAIAKLNIDQRITVGSMGTEMGAIILFLKPDTILDGYFKFVKAENKKLFSADDDAEYIETFEFDISNIKPLIACPPKPDNVFEVSEIAAKKILVDSVFVGSCTNGRITDIKEVCEILKGKKVHPRVMMKVVPATMKVYGEMLKEGLVQILYDSGVIVSNPGCGGCASGQIGMTGTGEIQLSTSNRNFKGKQGNGDTYLVSPATAAYTALTGYICGEEDL